jgi:hypothetical protein
MSMCLLDEYLSCMGELCKHYESATRAQLFGQYKVMEDRVVAILNQNKLDSKDHTMPVRQQMQGRRGLIREMWQKERANYHQLDLVIQLKNEAEDVKAIFKATEKEQKKTLDFLELGKENVAVYEGEERSAQEVRGDGFAYETTR